MRVTALDTSTVRGDMEDDFHRFGVTVRHDGARVVEVEGEGERYPWTTCPAAVEPLRALAGAPLSTRISALGDYAPADVTHEVRRHEITNAAQDEHPNQDHRHPNHGARIASDNGVIT